MSSHSLSPEPPAEPSAESPQSSAELTEPTDNASPTSPPTPDPVTDDDDRAEFVTTLPSPRGIWGALDTLVTDLVDTRRQIAMLQARESGLLAEAVDVVVARERDRLERDLQVSHKLPLREISAELGAAIRLSDRSVQSRMGTASLLVAQFPATYAALCRGEIDLAHAHAIVDAGAFIADAEKRAQYEARALSAAMSETPYRLGEIAKILAARIDPDAAKENIERSKDERSVRYFDLPHGRGQVVYEGPAVLARAIYDRLTSMAHQLTKDADRNNPDGADTDGIDTDTGDGVGPDEDGLFTLITGPDRDVDDDVAADPRTMDQKRADVFADILLTGAPTAHGDALAGIAAKVQITVPALTLLGHSDQPPILAGHGPIDLDTARRLAADAPGWDRVLTDPTSGEPVAVDRYRPTAALRRFLDVRDEHCRFPGCTRPPWHCDDDHTIDAALGGPTSDDNLAGFCRPHHIVKHHTLWRVKQLGHGKLRWTSPTGRTYIDTPVGSVTFVPEPAPF